MQTERWVATNPQTKPTDFCCESAIAIVIITQPRKGLYSFYRPVEGGRLSRPRHCSKGVEPVPKAVYRSGCCDKQWLLQQRETEASFVYIIAGLVLFI